MKPSKRVVRSWEEHQQVGAVYRPLRWRSSLLVAALLVAAQIRCGAEAPRTPQEVGGTERALSLFPPPILITPADGAALSDARPSFSWHLGQGPHRVVLQICADPACNIEFQSVTSSTLQARLNSELAPGTWYWRAARTAGKYRISAWSAIQHFLITTAPLVVTTDLLSVFSTNVHDVWAVGAAGTIVHYDGTWTAELSPTSQVLRSIWATTKGHAWAVGAGGTILRRNGTRWLTTLSPTTENLWGVWASSIDDAWAVGDAGLILHWDGTSWSIAHNRMTGFFRAIWGTGARDIWVVGGGKEPDGDYASLLLHWNGTNWAESYVCNPEGTRFASGGWLAVLSDVWGTPGGTVWATGSCQSGASFIPYGYVAQNDGAGWGDTPGFGFGLALGSYRPLQTIWSSSANDVWVASANETVSGTATAPTMLHWNGTGWIASSQVITAGINDLGGTSQNDVWAVGRAGKRLHYDGTTWTSTP